MYFFYSVYKIVIIVHHNSLNPKVSSSNSLSKTQRYSIYNERNQKKQIFTLEEQCDVWHCYQLISIDQPMD